MSAQIVFTNFCDDVYAVSVFPDENMNQTNFMGVPKEHRQAPNNPKKKTDHPTWGKQSLGWATRNRSWKSGGCIEPMGGTNQVFPLRHPARRLVAIPKGLYKLLLFCELETSKLARILPGRSGIQWYLKRLLGRRLEHVFPLHCKDDEDYALTGRQPAR
jgi:hypothetical protein